MQIKAFKKWFFCKLILPYNNLNLSVAKLHFKGVRKPLEKLLPKTPVFIEFYLSK